MRSCTAEMMRWPTPVDEDLPGAIGLLLPDGYVLAHIDDGSAALLEGQLVYSYGVTEVSGLRDVSARRLPREIEPGQLASLLFPGPNPVPS